ncbi:MG2 domain-containing protein [Flavobacteriaceae bacterium]|nr:MG2 domain-containing protein [Flavobacteriaceae bacterium]
MKQLLTLFSIIILTGSHAQNHYEKLWSKVEALELEGKTSSANEIVTSIYKKAKKKNNSSQLIKSLLYQSKNTLILKEDTELEIVQVLEKEINEADFPTNRILQSIVAEFKWEYLKKYRWQIYRRTKTTENVNTDFRTWDLNTLFSSIHNDYKKSIRSANALQNISILEYNYILTKGNEKENLRPTLFDLLANRALDFFKTNESRITKPKDRFYINNENYFSNSNSFVNLDIESNDSIFSKYEVLKTYQEIEKFHLKNNHLDALTDAFLGRLKFVKINFTKTEKGNKYLEKSLFESYTNIKKGNAYATIKANYAKIIYEAATLKNQPENRKKALSICNEIIRDFKDSEGFVVANNLKNEILHKSIQIKNEEIIPVNSLSKILVTYKNIKRVQIAIYKTDPDFNFYKYNYEDRDSIIKAFFKTKNSIKEFNTKLPQKNDYFNHSTEIVIPKLKSGRYIVLVTTEEVKSMNNVFGYSYQTVSNIACIESNYQGEKIFQITHRNSGKPLKDAQVSISALNTKKTDKLGEVSFENIKNKKAIISYQNDTLHIGNVYSNGYYNTKDDNKNEKHQGFLFLDRSIYRPGQEVFFKGIILSRENYKTKVVPNEKFNVIIKDVNYQEIKKIELTTNEFGSFSDTFKIPKDLLTGSFSMYIEPKNYNLQFNNGNTRFSVEEYKRPKFEVSFSPITENYQVNQNICIKGNANALAGSTITNAKVAYSVIRKINYSHWKYWNNYNSYESQEIVHGETITNENSEFEINFNALPDETSNKDGLPIFNYEIIADVTDINGETRSGTTNVKVGYHTINLNITNNEKWNVNNVNTIEINTTNLNNQFAAANINIQIFKLKAPNTILRKRKWNAPDNPLLSKEGFSKLFPNEAYKNEDDISTWKKGELVFQESINTQNKTSIEFSNLNWKSGNYVIIAKGKDDYNNNIEQEKRFELKQNNDTYLADNKLFSFDILNSNTTKKDGFIKVRLHTADKNLNVFTEAYFNRKIVYKENNIVNGNKIITIPLEFIKTQNSIPNSNVILQFYLVRFNQFITKKSTISLVEQEEKLSITTTVFRDNLQPGNKEKWSFTVKNKNGNQAEVLASMYDASLDQFKPHNWANNININDFYYNDYVRKSSRGFNARNFNVIGNKFSKLLIFEKQYDQLNKFGFTYNNQLINILKGKTSGIVIEALNSEEDDVSDFNYYRGNTFTKNKIDENGQIEIVSSDAIKYDTLANGKVIAIGSPGQIEQISVDENEMYLRTDFNKVKEDFKAIAARKNLNETAYFYPHLKTNSKGAISFEFETPEALTRWKVQLFGHTKNGVSGKLTENVVTQKELMVSPNPPRFLREKDTIIFQTKIANLTEKTVNGFAKLELYNAITGEVIDEKLNNTNAIQNIEINKKGSTSVSWKLFIPEGIQAVEYKVLAKAGNFSDGESSILPVLTNSMLVTESIPITVRANNYEEYRFSKLKNNSSTTLQNHQLTLEYTSNPAWYAIQSLPYLMEFPHECAEQTFSRYYANSIGGYILNSNPSIKSVFEKWKGNGQLTSKLEQNEDLKQLLISETPWLRDAQSDTEKKKRLGLLFDIEKLASEEKSIFNKLKQMQLPSGAFPWFSGGRDNEYITRYIVAGFGHLKKLGITNSALAQNNILKKSVQFLDNKFLENHNRKLKNQKLEDISVGNYELHYLYARSFFKNEIAFDKNIKSIVNTYINKAKKEWLTRSLLQKTMLSMVLHRFNDRQTPQLILAHLKETAIVNKQKGMYWKSNQPGYYWHEAPIETQALVIEAFSEITEDKNTIEELQIWLLNNKRKQDWKTTKATTEATYALLLQGNDWLSIAGTAKIKIGNKKIALNNLNEGQTEAGTGYFKTSWKSDEIDAEMADISIKNTSEITQFGGYYWQYFEELDNITNEEHTNDIKLHKELFVKKKTNNGPTLTKIEDTKLNIGDLITIRIELQVKDNFEFVHLKDMRASSFEPVNVMSKYKWQDGTGYYQSSKDVATHFFFDRLNKGSYVLEYDVRVNNAGDFSNGISTIQSMYAPEFSIHSKGIRVSITSK